MSAVAPGAVPPPARTSSFLSTQPPGAGQRRAVAATVAVSLLAFVALVPFAQVQLPALVPFIPIYASALVITDAVTMVLLLGQFAILRTRALLVLACGYLFTALITIVHALSFPGLFAPGGWLGAGPQSTAWLYMFWHGGFPLFVIAYARLADRDAVHQPPRAASSDRAAPADPDEAFPGGRGTMQGNARRAAALAIAGVTLLVMGCALGVSAGHELLPAVMRGNRYSPAMIVVVSLVWSLSGVALWVLWRRPRHSVLDLWLMAVMCAWICDIGLSAVFNAGRFDLGFYAGRIFGLLAASFVLVMLLLENVLLYAQLADAAGELARKNSELEESGRMKSEFLSTMSHELRTPLNAIIGFSEMLKDDRTGELRSDQKRFLGHIFHSGQHLLALINDILDLSKIEAGKAEITPEPVDLDALLAEGVRLIESRAATKQVRVRVDAQSAVGVLQADRRRLRQIVDNLLSNAAKFTPAGGQITVSAHRVDRAHAESALPGFAQGLRLPLPPGEFESFVEICVADTGIGIRLEDARKLFTPFTQVASPLTRNVEGTGLGLAMVRRLAELHGGTVAVSSEPGEGSCFTVWLPWRPVAGAHAAGPAPAAAPLGPLVLVVEDDEQAATLMRMQLEAENFRVQHAASAREALALARECTPDVITLDILLPDMDGWELLARLKEVPRWESIPVVVVSVVADQRRGYSLGASLVLQKPIGRDALAKGLGRLGLGGSGRDATVLVVDDDPGAVELLANHLHESGLVVLRALSGREGIELARRFRPDLIALDLEMPGVNGFDVVGALKDNPSTAHIPIIVVTSKELGTDDRQRLNGHILDIMSKAEFDHGHFVGEVRRALSRPV